MPDGGRYPHGSRGRAGSPHAGGGAGSRGGTCGRVHGCPPHGCGCGFGGCSGGCSTRWVSSSVPAGPARAAHGKPIDCPAGTAPKLREMHMRDHKEPVRDTASATGATATGAVATGAGSAGFAALLAAAGGAVALGVVAVGRLAIRRAVVHQLRVDELEIGHLRVGRLEVTEPGG
ncbi:MAG TPA: hypothetical protein VFL71_08815 [Actinomycetes bacterium]|nr:hypothetical protein [Actinomycetes bacterium]